MSKKATKPKVEDVLGEVLDGDAQTNALDFVAFLRANKLSPNLAAANSWAVAYKGQRVCFIRTYGSANYHNLKGGSWHICFANSKFANFDDEQYNLDEKLKNLIWDNISHCQNHDYACNPGDPMTIFGKKFDSVCHQWLFMINPDANAVECAKKIIMLYISSILRSKVV